MMKNKRLLIVEDSFAMINVYKQELIGFDLEITFAQKGERALAFLAGRSFDLVILDLFLPDMNGMEILDHINENRLCCGVIVITADKNPETAVLAMEKGAADFIEKPFNQERFRVTVRNVLRNMELEDRIKKIQSDGELGSFEGFIGSSPPMQTLYKIIQNISSSDATVFITGESGTGKEVCARAIHSSGGRADMPFVAINCAAIPKDLLESEIFGHVKGAFSGAVNDRIGVAKQADGGVLFLDEICEMDLNLQTKLLRFVQTLTFTPVGSSQSSKVDVRLVCATNRDPRAEVESGNFREDLFYRLFVISIHLPRLNERGNDVIEIAESFLRDFSKKEKKAFKGFSGEVKNLLLKHEWNGNIRELQNTVQKIVIFHNGSEVTAEMLPSDFSVHKSQGSEPPNVLPQKKPEKPRSEILPLWMQEKEAIEKAVQHCDGNITKAASLLEVNPSTIYRKMKKWDSDFLPDKPPFF